MDTYELFDQACALILVRLEEEFPHPIKLDDRDMGFFERMPLDRERETKALILSDAFEHLKKHGYIEFTSPAHRLPRENLKLTTKGLTRLRSTPDGLPKNNETLGEQLKNALSYVSNTGTDTVTKEVFKAFSKLLTG